MARIARVPWWRRLLPARKPTAFCSRCGRVLDNGQRLPRGTRVECMGTANLAGPSEPDRLHCYGAMVVLG